MEELEALLELLEGRKIINFRNENPARIEGWNQAIEHIQQVVRNRVAALQLAKVTR